MPRIVSTAWFEDIGYINQPMFDFKLVTLTIRQTVHLFLWCGLAFLTFSKITPFFGMGSVIYRAVPALTVFALGMAVFGRKGKVFSPEWYLLHFAKGILPGFGSSLSFSTPAEDGTSSDDHAKEEGSRPIVAPMGEPTRIAGVLFDPSTGKRLSNVSYEVTLDGEPYHSGRTDEDGSYSLIFTPPGRGSFTLSVTPEGYPEGVEKIEVDSRPGGDRSKGPKGEKPEKRTSLEETPEEQKEETRGGEEHVYELFPVNFADLPEDEKDSVVDGFRNFLNSLNCEIKILAVKTSKEVELGNKSTETEFFKFYVKSEEAIGTKLDSAGFRYQKVARSLEPQVVRSFKDFAAVEGGRNVKTGTVYEMREQIVEGFPSLLYGPADRITIKIRPLDQAESVNRMERFVRMKQTAAAREGTKTKRIEAQRAQEAVERLSEGSSRLFESTINITAGGETEEEMEDNYERIESICEGRMIRIDDPLFVQEEMLRGEIGKTLYLDTVTLGAFFPFVSSNVIETPGGVFLGTNLHTGAPVLYDPMVRSNAHASFVGRTGAGKSFAMKTYLTRLFEKHRDMAYFIIDPENEYTRPALSLDRTGTQIRHVKTDEPLGLDPLKLFPREKSVVISMLAEALNLSDEESGAYSNLRVGVQRCGSLSELRDWADEDLTKRLNGLLEGPEKFLFEGEPKELSERAVFDLSDLHEGMRVAKKRVGMLDLASILIFGQIWRKIEKLPREKLKTVLIDEVWLYTKVPAAASFLENVARRGRRRNVVFLLASQRPDDVLASEAGRTALENSATKVILQQDQSAAELVGDAFGLTESEVDATLDFEPGQAILSSRDVKVPLKFVATSDEYRRFTTKPGEAR